MVTSPMDATIYTMKSMLAVCSGTGFPVSYINWTLNGQRLQNGSRIRIFENVTTEGNGEVSVVSLLKICSVMASDEGIYTCTITNKITNDSANFTLTVRGTFNDNDYVYQINNYF